MARSIREGGARVALAAALVASAGSCDFVSPTEVDPNSISTATLQQLFTGIQANTFRWGGANLESAVWLQQMAGTDRQSFGLGQYRMTERGFDGAFSELYVGGGLVDLRRTRALAEELGCEVCAGIVKIHQAHLFGQAASIWGDIPYSQAARAREFPQPRLDTQAEVYASVQALLDEAIGQLRSGRTTAGEDFLRADLRFAGDAEAWIAVAHSLKARFHLQLAEVDPARYTMALEEARQGIDHPSGDWTTVHTATIGEQNPWHQLIRLQSGYFAAGEFLVELLTDRDDPRLPLYFTTGFGEYAGQYVGATKTGGGPGQNASTLNVPGEADYSQPIVTCAETQLIAAEAALVSGQADPVGFLNAGLACEEAKWGIVLPRYTSASLADVMEEKYIANFLHMEVWNDYKRTCLPPVVPVEGRSIPRRAFYGATERSTNPNIPPPSEQPAFNANDPNPC